MKCDICHTNLLHRFKFYAGEPTGYKLTHKMSYNVNASNTKHYHERQEYGIWLCEMCDKKYIHKDYVLVPSHIRSEQHRRYVLAYLKKGNNGHTIRKDTVSSIIKRSELP